MFNNENVLLVACHSDSAGKNALAAFNVARMTAGSSKLIFMGDMNVLAIYYFDLFL